MPTVIALSDLHANLETLDHLARMQKHYPDAVTVFIGDYIDSFTDLPDLTLLKKIRAMQLTVPEKVIVLQGNHEAGMLAYLMDPIQDDWLYYGGLDTLRAASAQWGPYIGPSWAREQMLAREAPLIDWLTQLPTIYQLDQLCFVHAGLDLALPDPLLTTVHDRLWLDEAYWYLPGKKQIFNHNRLPYAIISGHTPTGRITGHYQNRRGPARREPVGRNAIFTIQYPDEYPRYFIDGGLGSRLSQAESGNIAVFNSHSAFLIDAYED